MDPFVRGFLKAALLWLLVGGAFGLAMVFWPMQALGLRPAHAHANLLGFVSMMIYGVGYHVLPRFTGNPLHDRRLAVVHLWLANLGLLALVLGWTVRLRAFAAGELLLRLGALLAAAGLLLFVYNLWRTLGAPEVATRIGPVPPRPGPRGSNDPSSNT